MVKLKVRCRYIWPVGGRCKTDAYDGPYCYRHKRKTGHHTFEVVFRRVVAGCYTVDVNMRRFGEANNQADDYWIARWTLTLPYGGLIESHSLASLKDALDDHLEEQEKLVRDWLRGAA